MERGKRSGNQPKQSFAAIVSDSTSFFGGAIRLLCREIQWVRKCVPAKENTVDSNEPTVFILVEDGGLEPSTSAM